MNSAELRETPRYPVAVSTGRNGGPIVACSDGTVWWWCNEFSEWYPYDPVPGTPADADPGEGGES